MSIDEYRTRSDFDELLRRGQAGPDNDDYDISICAPCARGDHAHCRTVHCDCPYEE